MSYESRWQLTCDDADYQSTQWQVRAQDKSGCVGRVIATDLDDSLNGSVFYWRDTVSNVAADVVYPDGGFDVLSDSGLICTEAGPLEAGEYRIRVFAKDRGQPARIANENRPVAVHISILRGGRSFSPGTQRDRDSLQFTYVPPKTHTLQDNLPCGHQLFTFAVSDSLDPSGLSTRVSVTPFDNRRPVFSPEKFSKDALAHIDVTDLSKASHILGAAGYQVQASLKESVLVGSLVCRLEAYVPMISGDPISPLEYSVFTVGQDVTRQAFNLNTQTGELRVAQPLDHETISQHYLLISVRRMINPSLCTFINVFVNVSNTNEHAPQFLTVASSLGSATDHLHSAGFTFFVNGISPVGTVVGRVTAVDPDSGDNGRIRYSIVGEDTTAYFEIDPVTGDLRISKPLLPGFSRNPSGDSFHLRWVHEHRVIVAATDNGRPVSRSNHTVVLVQIIPGPGGIDAPAPRFRTTGTVHFTVTENTPPDYVITSLSQLLTIDSMVYGFIHFDLISAYTVDLLADHNTAVVGIQQPQSVANLELFHVTANTGLLVTLVHLDRERHGDLHRLVVRVKGSSGIRAEISDYLMLEIQIIDVNDNTPKISTPRFIRGYVSEGAPPGSLVMQQCVLNDILDACMHSSAIPVQIIATDPDLGLNGQIVYQLMSASTQESARLFNLDSTNGLLRVSPDVQLDRETASHHSLFVQVSDSGSPARTADNLIRIEIEVLDVNDSPPVFDETFYMRTLMLPTYPSELIVQLSATDPDMNDTVSYRFSDQLSANYFTLDALTGRLSVAPNSSLLNHNLPMSERNFLVMVEAYDSHKPKPHVARINVTVFTQLSSPSAGDSTPLIIDPEGGLDVNLVEHYTGHEPLRLGQLKVRNAPVGAIYRFIVLTPQPGLTVDRLTGTVLATGDQSTDELDRELTPNMTMHVLVRDMHNRLGRTVVRVHLSDVNDHTPLFIGQPYHAVFCLSSAISTDRSRPDTELPCRQNHFQVIAVDKDYGSNGSIAYSLTSIRPRADPPLLTIDAKTGQLTLLRLIPPDWTGRQMDAVVLAMDGGGLSASATITVHLVSHDGPRFSASHYTASVSESAPIGEAVTTVEASSPNPAISLIYRVVSVRTLNSSAGADVPNWMSVEVTDSPFMLEFNTGILRLVSSLDYEVTTGYLLLLEVLDTSSSLSARVYLSVNVTDVNDVAPQFAVPVYTAYVSERESVGYFVLQLSARDPDSGYGGQISYSLEPHLPESMSPDNLSLQFAELSKEVLSYFSCDEHTGLITLARTLNYDILPTLRFWAVATDQAAEPLNSRVPVTVHVLDYNDHAPQLDSPSSSDSVGGSCLYKAKLNEHAPPGTVVLRLLASDLDVNDTLRYKLLPSEGGHSDHFRLSPTDGVLRWVPIRSSDGKVAVPPRDSATVHSSVKDPSGFRIGVDAIPESMFGVLQLQAEVSDGIHTASCDIQIELDAGNWNTPRFPHPKHEIWNVSEAATHLGQIRFATDSDRGKFGKLTYVLFGGHGREQFRLDSFSGDLYALEPLDRESVDHYQLIIRVSDGGGLFDYMLLELYIQDVNDNRPQLVQLIYEFVLFPDEYNPQVVHFPFRTALYLQATDADKGPNAQLIYRRFQPPESLSQTEFEQSTHVIDVDPRSGELLFLAALTNSSITAADELQFFVEACDSPVGGLSNMLCSSPARVVIHLAARPLEFRPRIACTFTPVLEDDHSLDRDVASCQVQPSNLTGTWSLTYVLHESSISAPAFRIDSHSGHVYTTRPMDYEHGRSYRLGVEFHIANMKPNVAAAAARTELQINLVDVNDCVPELDAPVYVVKVPENVPIGTRLTGVSAQDKDVSGRDPITFSLWPVVSSLEWELGVRSVPDVSTDLPLRLHNAPHANLELNLIRKQFMVDSDGWIVLKTPLDFETVREHKFKVAAVDSVGHWNSSLVIISVMDVNDNAPHWPLKEAPNDSLEHFIFPDVLHRQLLHTEVTIPENWSPTVNSVIYQINVVDPDVEVQSRPFFYMLSEENVSLQAHAKPSTYFSVSPSGAVQLRKALDRELAASYILRFRASDGIFVTKDAFVLQVNVKDVNDNAPFCLEPQRHLVFPENTPQGTVIAKLLAIDNDAEPIHSNVSYRLKSGDHRLFAVNSSTGLIRLQGLLDFESERLHRFSVEASDNGGLNCLFHCTVQVVDVNDNAPEFEPVFINPIPEDVPVGSLIGKITARDRDVSDANRLVYSLQSTHDASFSIEPHTGLLKVSRTLDRETKSVHNLTVIVSDGLPTLFGGITSQTTAQFTVTTTFTVRLLDVNDSPPQFVNSSAHKLHVSELAPAGRHMTRLTAVSLDEGENAVVRYKLLTKQPEFSLNETTGDLRLEGALDHERVSSYFLTVEARDHGTPPLSTTAVITVNVEDENDNQPQFVGRQPIPITLLAENGGISLTDELKGLLSSFYSFTVAENSRNGTVIGRGCLRHSQNSGVDLLPGERLTVLDYADDKVLLFDDFQSAQVLLDVISRSATYFEMRFAASKCKVILQGCCDYVDLMLDNVVMEIVDRFVYLGSYISVGGGGVGNEIEARISKARAVFDNLRHLWRQRGISLKLKGRVYKTTVRAVLLYGSETWPLRVEDVNRLQVFDHRCLRSIARIGWHQRLKAVDADSGEHGRLTYRLSPTNSSIWMQYIHRSLSSNFELLDLNEARSRFHLDVNTGQLSLLFEPDREAVDEFWFSASVDDHGIPSAFTSHTLVRVRILDVNDCSPLFEKSAYEFTVQPLPSTITEVGCHSAVGGRVLIGRLKLTDADASPNAGPFTCQLIHSGSAQSSSDSSRAAGGMFFVRNASSDPNHNNRTSANSNPNVGECLLYAVDRLPVGSQSLVLRANDNGLTALHTSVTVTVRVIRQANLPPEIVRGNATLTYYRGSYAVSDPMSVPSDDLSANLVVARVTIKDRTAHDRLTFELLPDSPGSTLFRVDRYDGTVRSASSAARSDAHSTANTDHPTHGQSNGYRHPVYPILSTPLSRLDSGLYPLRIRVSNGSLSSEETLFIQVVTITDEMLESAAIVRISNLLPNLFYMESYDRRLRLHLASCLLTDMRHFVSSGHSLNDHVHILSVQEADIVLTGSPSSVSLHRVPRSLDRAVDVLVAVYNPEQREFIKPHLIAEAVNQISDTLSSEFGGKVSVIYDVCTPQFCPRGRCYTRVTIDPHGLMNRVEVHRVSQVSPRFTLSPACRCPRHFTGLRCDTPLDGCSLAASCPAPRICVPQGPDSSVCVCPPPRTGPNCESVQPVGPHPNACYSERCFLDREHGSLQFTGGSFIHWELVHCNSYHWEFTFAMRTRQPIGPLATIRWNALRAFQLRLATGGRLVVSALGISDGLPSADWLVSADPLSDGHWHRVRLVLAATSANHLDNVHNLLFRPLEDGGSPKPVTVASDKDWWVELTVDGIHPRSASIDWAPGDPVRQGLFLGSDPVHGFWPLTQQLPFSSAPILGHAQQAEYNSDNTTLEESIVLRSGIVGCFRDIRINQVKPPYQINHQAVLARLRAEYASSSPGSTNLVLMRAHQLHYGCDPSSTVAGPCATGPCLHGGICAPGQLPAHQQQSSSGGSYACHCPPLFHGHHCERTSDACLLKPCQNGGSCQALFNPNTAKMPTNSGLAAYRCVCPAGVSGLHCELLHDTSSLSGSALSLHSPIEKNKGLGCRSARLVLQHTSPTFSLNTRQSIANARWSAITRTSSTPQVVCLNGGVCLESASGPHCSCPLGWEGARCEHDINECQLADTFFARRGADRFTDSTRNKWMELHVPGSGGLCSPYEMGRGVCVNSPGSYQCNCSLGFGGRHCQNKNLVPLTPDPNALGLTQLHVYIIVGLLAFLFLAALTTIVILACRARGFIGAALEVDGTSKSVGSYVWPPGGKSQQQQRHSHQQASQKPSTHSLDQQFYRYNHSGGSSLAGVPFLPSGSGLPMHSNQLGMHSSCHGFPTVRMANRRPSLASSTFAMPLHANDDSGAALLAGQTESVQHASSSSAAPTITDYMDQEDCSATGASRLLLYPTGGGDPVPVMMMMSPAMPYAGSVGNRTSLLPRHSPATSAIYYGSANLSGTGTPTNHGSSSYIGYNIDPPGSVCIPPRHLHSASHRVAFYPAGAPHAYLAQHQTQRQLPQLVTVRPGSAVGSDRLSLGSGSDRFSAHSSQLLVPSNPSSGPHLTGPYGSHAYPHYQVVPTSAQQPSRPHTSQDLNPYGSDHPGSPSDETTRTLRPDNTDTLRPSLYFNGGTEEHEGSERPVGITHTHADYYKPRPLPAKLQHIPQSVAQPMNPTNLSSPDLAIHSNGDVNPFSVLDGEATPTLHKAKELKSPAAPIVDDLSMNEMRQLSTISPAQAQDSSAFRPHSGVGKQFCNCNQPDPYSRTNELVQNGPSTGVVVQEAADTQHASPRSLDCHAPAAEPVHNDLETDYKPGTTCAPRPVNSDSRDLNGFASN
ncbi:protocadherin Fat 1/2/3 [Paragonimus westermani]|uniref:Protocadherin Fat 1/2/3 n=2 Tax=Paragonimus westermani TaxID=34504 RepID=A0A5J4NXN0_9TREM|nr:protocadherin Fat 1/2/3 [Paragonimus westermani]